MSQNEIVTLILMALSAALAAWWFDRKTLVSRYNEAIAKMVKSAEDTFKVAKQIEEIHNEQAKVLIDMSKRLEDLGLKVNTASIFNPKR